MSASGDDDYNVGSVMLKESVSVNVIRNELLRLFGLDAFGEHHVESAGGGISEEQMLVQEIVVLGSCFV